MLKIHCFVCETFCSNVYALEDEISNVWLIDAGNTIELMDYLATGKKLKGIFLTHTHFDHINGLNQIIELYPEVDVYGHRLSQDYLNNPERNLSLFNETPFSYSGKIQHLQEGVEIQLNEKFKIRTLEVPGHHPTCLAFQVGKYLFTGDAYIPGTKVVTHLPEGNKEFAKQTEERIIAKASFLGMLICPGHTLKNNNKL